MSSITLHPKLGVNPRLTFCPRCGKEGQELVLLGIRNYYAECPSCGTRCYGGFDHDKCPSCGNQTYGAQRTELKESERIPGGICESCEKEIAEHRHIVEAGGVYWKCSKCNASGVIKESAPAAAEIRRLNGEEFTKPIDGKYKPCGIDFTGDECCPGCQRKKEGER